MHTPNGLPVLSLLIHGIFLLPTRYLVCVLDPLLGRETAAKMPAPTDSVPGCLWAVTGKHVKMLAPLLEPAPGAT